MLKKCLSLLFACVMLVCVTVPGSAEVSIFGDVPEGDASVVTYGFKGLWLGAQAGLAAGYLRYNDENDKGKEIGLSAAYGSLAGAGLGLALGIMDAANGEMGTGAVILRDMQLTGTFGLLIGGIWGGINALNNDDAELLGEGAAWGFLGGTVLGAAIGLLEGPALRNGSDRAAGVRSSVVCLQDSEGKACPALFVSTAF